MKKQWRRLLSSLLSLVMVLTLLPTMVLADESSTSSGTSSSTSTGSGAFGLPEATGLTAGTDEYKNAVADAPYGSSGNVVPLFVKSELYMTYGWSGTNRYTHVFDYNQDNTDGSKKTILGEGIFESLENRYRTKFSADGTGGILTIDTAAVNADRGKQEYVAVLGLGKGSSYLELRDKDDVLVSSTNLGGKSYLTEYAYELGGFAAVTAGDFDGDGVDSIVYYDPGTSSAPIYERTVTTVNDTVTINTSPITIFDVYTQLIGSGSNAAKDIPVVHLEAADVDKDGYDELIVTAGRNDVTNNDTALGTQVFIYDKLDKGWTLTASYAPTAATGFAMGNAQAASQAQRYVWSTSSVGNVIVGDDSSTGTDFPEIVTAGWVDISMDGSNGKDIALDEKTIGVMMVHCTGMTEAHKGQANYQGKYELAYRTTLTANGWTQAGCYKEDDRNSLLQVKCFSYQGGAQAEAIFLSGSVYTYQNNNGNASLGEAYTYDYYTSGDSYIGSTKITNKQIQSVAVGNFDGNSDGREQVVFANLVKKSGATQHYVSFYVYGCGADNLWTGTEVDGWPVRGQNGAYVSLTDFDCDEDGILVQYEDVERVWENCDILAILEPQPYFAELLNGGDDLGEGHTAYGKSSSTGSSSESSHGFSIGIVTGFESEVAGFGGGFEMSVENGFTWSTNVSRTEEHSVTYENQTGENMVVVYRTPVLIYTYRNVSNGNDMYVAKTLTPEVASVSLEEYNDQAEANGLPLIDESKLVTAGDPFSYPSNVTQITNAGGTGVTTSNSSWTVLSNTNTEKSITITQENESSFEYELEVNTSVWGVGFGAKFGYTGGYSYTHSSSKLNGIGTEYSGSVMGPVADGYSFNWNFAMWNMTVGGKKVPVLGYLVKDAAAPASPPTAVDVDYSKLTSSSARLTWEAGSRPAAEYRIYRVLSDGSYSLLTSVDGDATEYTISGLGASMTYTFVLRAVLNGVESVDSESVTFTTPKEGGKSYVTIGKVENQGTTAGGSATFSANVTKSDSNVNLTIQWQERDADSGEWEDVRGASGTTLTVSNAKPSQNGTKYRLRIAAVTLAESTPIYYFSNAATLSVGALETSVTTVGVTGMTNSSSGSGTMTAPYTGLSNWSKEDTKTTTIDVNVPYTFNNDEGTVYSHTSAENVYLGVVNNNGAKTYYALTKDGESFTAGDALSLVYVDKDEIKVSGMKAEWADSVYTTGADTEVYTAYATLDESNNVTLYWEKDGRYYTEAGGTYTEASGAAPKYIVCYYGEETVTTTTGEPSEEPSEGTTTETVYVLKDFRDDSKTSEEGSGTETTTDTTAYLTLIKGGVVTSNIKPDGYLPISGGKYLPSDFAVYTRQDTQDIAVTTTTPKTGTALTLSATATSGETRLAGQSAFFLITNTADGTSYRVEATTNANGEFTGTWTAPTAGLYSIRAGVNASTNYRASSSETAVYYAALQNNSKGETQSTTYIVINDENSSNVGSSVEYGTTLYFKTYTVSAVGGTPSGEDKAVTLRLPDGETKKEVAAGGTYAPDRAGQFAVIEYQGEGENRTEISKLVFTVTPLALKVTPKLPEDTTVPSATTDFELKLTGALGSDTTSLNDLLSVKDENGYFDNTNGGVFTFTPAWSEEPDNAADVQRLTGAYSVTLESISLRREEGKLPVTYTVNGGHGTLFGSYGGSLTSFTSGTQLATGTKLQFQANPETGYRVASWKVNGTEITSENTGYTIADQTGTNVQTLTINSLTGSVSAELTVEVTFTAQFSNITFSAGANGTLSAATAAGSPINSGDDLTYGGSVTFTATPSNDYMIGGWTVNGEPYYWPDTTTPYQEATLTLSDLSLAEYDVKVSFAEKATFTVVAPWLATSDGTIVTTGSIRITNAADSTAVTAGSSVTKGTALTYTVTFNDPSFNTVSGWEYSTDGTNWTVGGSGASFTVRSGDLTFGDGDAKLYVRAVVSVSQMKTLNWTFTKDTELPATLTVTTGEGSNAVTLTSGSSYPVGTVVTFTLTVNNDLHDCVKTWSNNVTPSADGLSATLTLNANSTVSVTASRFTPTVTTVPAAITGLTYTGGEQALVTAGSTNGGTLQYRLGDTGDYSADIPKVTNAGSYTVYYKVAGNACYTDLEDENFKVDVTVAQAEQTVTANADDVTATYGDTDKFVSATGTGTGAVTYAVTDGDDVVEVNANTGTLTTLKVGSATVTATAASDTNYREGTATITVTVTQKEVGLDWGSTSLSYTGSAQAPAATATGLVIGDSCTVTVEGAQINAGDGYTATATDLSNSNYKLPSNVTATFSIERIDPTTPSDLVGYKDDTLSTVGLPEGWSWVNGAQTMSATGEQTFYANYEGDTNHNEKTNVALTVNVSDKTHESLTVSMTGWTYSKYNATTNAPSYTVADGAGAVTVRYKVKDANDSTYTATVPTNAGEYTVRVSYETATVFYSGTANFTINKATPTGAPKYTAITESGKTLADAALTTTDSTFSVEGSAKWVNADNSDLSTATTVAANATYKWLFTPNDTNYTTLTGSIKLYSVSTPSDLGGDGGGGGGGGSAAATTVTVPVSSDHASVEVQAEVNKGNATVEVSDKQVEQVIADGAGEVTLDVSGLKNVESATVPAHVVEKTNEAENTGLTVALPAGSVTLDETALESVTENANGKDVTVSVVSVPTTKLPTAVKDIIGMEPTVVAVVDVNVIVNGVKQSSFSGGRLTISIPYTPKAGEDTSKLTVWFIKDNGTIENKGGYYDAKSGCFVFETEHLSQYLLVNTNELVSFTDVSADAWYAAAVNWAVAKDITGGIGDNRFGPDLSCTRAQLVTFLYRAAVAQGMDVSVGEDTNILSYTDALEIPEYAFAAFQWAVGAGIVQGYDGALMPNDDCTRGQIVTMLHRFAVAAGKDVSVGEDTNILSYADAFEVPEYAVAPFQWATGAGIIQGSDGKLMPSDTCTRGQIVTMLYRLLGE